MHVTLVHVHLKPDNVAAFIAATEENHNASTQEADNLRFGILQSPENATCFILYGAYVNKTEAEKHKVTAHYLLTRCFDTLLQKCAQGLYATYKAAALIAWRETVADWMASPRQGEPQIGLFPKVTQ